MIWDFSRIFDAPANTARPKGQPADTIGVMAKRPAHPVPNSVERERVERASGPLSGAPLQQEHPKGVRLQKILASAGVASRRRCEELIVQGGVSVNGCVVTSLPAWADPSQDEIVVEGRRLARADRKLVIMLNKPRRIVTTCDDPGGRRTVADLVDHPAARRLFPVGRLDYDTSGLLLLTNDGELANRLTHPRYEVAKAYRAKVRGRVEPDELERLGKGLFLVERRQGSTVGASRTAPVLVRIVHRDRERTLLELTLKEGRNRQVRRMLAKVGHPVVQLERIRLGPLRLKGLARGEWRELTRQELASLRRAPAGRASVGRKSVGRASVGRASGPS